MFINIFEERYIKGISEKGSFYEFEVSHKGVNREAEADHSPIYLFLVVCLHL